MNLNIIAQCNRHADLLQAANHAVSDSIRDGIVREVLHIENRLAEAKPRTEDERRAMLGVVASAMEAQGLEPVYVSAIRATL